MNKQKLQISLKCIVLLSMYLLFSNTLFAQYFDDLGTIGDGTQLFSGQRIYKSDNTTLSYKNKDSFTLQYDNQNRLLSRKNLLDSANNNVFKEVNIDRYEYTPSGLVSLYVDTVFDGGGCLKREYFYNTNSKCTTSVTSSLVSSSWHLHERFQNTYNTNDSVLVSLNETMNYITNNWGNYKRTIHVYNTQERDSIVTIEIWNANTNNWRGLERQLYTYNTNNLILTRISQLYDTISGTYKNYNKDSYTYNANNKVATYLTQNWNTATNGWLNNYTFSYAYNSNGNVQDFLIEIWNANTASWDFSSINKYSYNANNILDSSLVQSFNGSQFENTMLSEYIVDAHNCYKQVLNKNWNSANFTWQNFYRYDNWYKPKGNPQSIEGIAPKINLSVFPNPSTNGIVFVNSDKKAKYVLSDMNGRMVSQGELISGSNSLMLMQLQAGMYILNAEGVTTKIVLQ